MDFVTSEYYLYFLPAVVAMVFLLRRSRRDFQILVMLFMSYLFFWLASGWHIILLLFSTVLDWNAGKNIHKSDDKNVRKRWLLFSLSANLGLLATFKYLDFFIESLNFISSNTIKASEIGTLGILLPVGISFYTFQTMSYTIDIYRGKNKPYENFFDFACYAAFFPQLVAGPIVRSQHFLEQIQGEIKTNPYRFRLGLTLIFYGLMKKFLIADNVALHVNSIFVEGSPLDNILLVWWGSLCFGIQIYCDFSAYTDIAIGSGHLMGIELPENFRTPYAAKSPQDFWRRWHISLSTWLRDYLYIPLGGSRGGTYVLITAIMGTMLLGGLWHGASWNFVLWGFIHGLLLLVHRYLSNTSMMKLTFLKAPRVMFTLGYLVTQFFVFMTWLIFRVEDTAILWPSLKAYIGIEAVWDVDEFLTALPDIQLLTFAIVIFFIIGHFVSGAMGGFKFWIAKQNSISWGLICGIMLSMAFLFKPAVTIEFIYFRF
tara:strand:- start:588 stop:2042 length:1455 start_codon:yes stop_codon:yes gene_type:complete